MDGYVDLKAETYLQYIHHIGKRRGIKRPSSASFTPDDNFLWTVFTLHDFFSSTRTTWRCRKMLNHGDDPSLLYYSNVNKRARRDSFCLFKAGKVMAHLIDTDIKATTKVKSVKSRSIAVFFFLPSSVLKIRWGKRTACHVIENPQSRNVSILQTIQKSFKACISKACI